MCARDSAILMCARGSVIRMRVRGSAIPNLYTKEKCLLVEAKRNRAQKRTHTDNEKSLESVRAHCASTSRTTVYTGWACRFAGPLYISCSYTQMQIESTVLLPIESECFSHTCNRV